MNEPGTQTKFLSIAVDALKNTGIPPLDLYISQGPGDPVLLHNRNLPIDQNFLKRLHENHIHSLLVTEEDYSLFEDSLVDHFVSIVNDPTVPIESKCDVTYDLSSQLMQHAYESADPGAVIHSAEQVVNMVIDVIFQDQKAAHNFLIRTVTDYALYSHSVNVCLLGVSLAKRALGISKQTALSRFGPGLLLHDIGMTKISKDVYEQTDPLGQVSNIEMLNHPRIGLETVREFVEITPESESIILHHHERLDGSGYPFGLKDEEISIGAKICAIVDTFDALNTQTKYRDRLPSFEALIQMKKCIPEQLDEKLFREFIYIFLPPI